MKQSPDKGERRRNRRVLSCLPCREHKLKCDRHVPCQACCRYRREASCRQHPASISLHLDSSSQPSSREVVTQAAETFHRADRSPQFHPRALKSSLYDVGAHTSRTNQRIDSRDEPFENDATGFPVQVSAKEKESQEHQPPLTVSLLPQLGCIASSWSNLSWNPFHAEFYWRAQLLATLPTRNQCDMLVSYFLENINWIYHVIHVPMFRKAYGQFWDTDSNSVDVSWLSLLFIVISESALCASSDVAQAIGWSLLTVRNLSHVWYTSSRQALHASSFESKPQLVHLQTFLVTQRYWLATKNVEAMNSYVS